MVCSISLDTIPDLFGVDTNYVLYSFFILFLALNSLTSYIQTSKYSSQLGLFRSHSTFS